MGPIPKNVPARQKLACIIFAVTCPILACDYWQNDGSITFVGRVPLLVLFVIAALGGAVSFLMFTSGHLRRIAAIPGAIAGIGGFGLHFLYTTWLELDRMSGEMSVALACLGAAPGILLLWILSKVIKPDETVARDE